MIDDYFANNLIVSCDISSLIILSWGLIFMHMLVITSSIRERACGLKAAGYLIVKRWKFKKFYRLEISMISAFCLHAIFTCTPLTKKTSGGSPVVVVVEMEGMAGSCDTRSNKKHSHFTVRTLILLYVLIFRTVCLDVCPQVTTPIHKYQILDMKKNNQTVLKRGFGGQPSNCHGSDVLMLPPDHLLLDSAPNIGPLISRWELDKFKNCWNKSFINSEILTLLYQQFSNLLISQRDMSGPILGTLSNNRWSGGI